MTTYASIDQLPPEYREQAAAQMADKRPSRHPALRHTAVVKDGQPVQRQSRENRAQVGGKRKHKYNAQAVEVDGIRFASKKEAERYLVLKARQAAGEIRKLKLQPSFELQPAFEDVRGKKIRAVNYVADFQYVENGHIIVEDVKGVETAVFKLKRKLFLFKYGRQVVLRIVK